MFYPQKLLFSLASAALLVNAVPVVDIERRASAAAACSIVRSRQNLSPAFADSAQYVNDISHWSNASSLPALCTVQPNTPQEIQQLFQIIKETRTPWAVKGKGHCNNNDMSSTYGLQIAMSEFSQITLSKDKKSVKLGLGLDWAQVYRALEPENLLVIGGRTGTVGVAGLAMSSGYAWQSSQHGFAIDNILEADIVLPNGTFTTVSESRGSDIFYALQGGLNNFGIVTSLTLRTFPTGKVWGGALSIEGDLSAMKAALVEYAAKPVDPKATMNVFYTAINGTLTAGVILYYDAPTPPAGLYDAFIKLNATGSLETRPSFYNFVSTQVIVPAEPANRATWYSAPILKWTREIVDFIGDLALSYSIRVAKESRSGTLVTGNMEPFGVKTYSFNRGSAWPHDVDHPFNTFNGLFMWSDPLDDKLMFGLTAEYHTKVWDKAIELGISKPKGQAFFPPNYSISSTPVEQIYGPNLGWLRALQRKVDPSRLISLTGGFKI